VGKPPFGLKAALGESLHKLQTVGRTDEEIEVLCATNHSRIGFQSECPTDQKGNPSVPQARQRLAIDFMRRIFGYPV
jgi:hypothetical protein